jgi:tetratricopeptide (TPR) repeat protein
MSLQPHEWQMEKKTDDAGMQLDERDSSRNEDRLGEAILTFLKADDDDRPLAPERLLGQFPDVASELSDFFADQDRLEPILAPLRGMQPSDGYPRRFGDYELCGELGRGGMGVVYRANEVGLKRTVALKMIRGGRWASKDDLMRFRREAEAAANLDHPNIMPIYHVGEHEGQLYFSMRLMEGGSLWEELQKHETDPPRVRQRWAAGVVATVANAVQHAHRRGILHRDLKPSNVLLDTEGRPYVADFGLAKQLDSDTELTRTGMVLGTPAYMAPEQAAPLFRSPGGGDRATLQVSPAADVCGLGAILYALLTSRPPFQGATPLDTLAQVKLRDPDPPSRSGSQMDRDLETICLKCLEKDPARRFGSPDALAEDLERWLSGKPIRARAIGPFGRLVRRAKRNPALAALVSLLFATVLIATATAAVGAWKYTADLKHAKEVADRQRQEADRQRKLALENLRSIIAEIDDLENRRPELDDLRRDVLLRFQKYLRAILEDPSHSTEADESNLWLEIHAGDICRDHEREIPAARGHYQRAHAIADAFAEKPDRGRTRKRLRSFSLSRLADADSLEGNHSAALENYRQMLVLRERIYAERPDRLARADLAVAHLKLGDGYERFFGTSRKIEYRESEHHHYTASHRLYESLVRDYADDIEYARMFAHTWDRLGDARSDAEEWAAAIDACLAAIDFRKAAGGRFPDCELAFEIENTYSLDRLAIVYMHTGQFGLSQQAAERTIELRSDLVKRNPRSNWFKERLMGSYLRFGNCCELRGRIEQGLANCRRAYEIARTMRPSSPDNLRLVLDNLINTGYHIREADDDTVRFSEERASVRRKLIAANPGDRHDRWCFFHELQALGDLHLMRGCTIDARRRYLEALQFSNEEPTMGWTDGERDALHKRLKLCERAVHPDFYAAKELMQLHTLASDPLVRIQTEFEVRKDYAQLARVSEKLSTAGDNLNFLRAAARGYALAASLAPPGGERQSCDRRARELIARLRQFGHDVRESMRQDPAFQRYERDEAVRQ